MQSALAVEGVVPSLARRRHLFGCDLLISHDQRRYHRLGRLYAAGRADQR